MSSTAPPRPLSRSCGMSAALGRPLWPRWPHSLAARLAAHQRVRGLTRVRASLAWAGTWHGTWKQGGYVDETPGTVEGSERRRERAREGERRREKAREGERRREKAKEGGRMREKVKEGERRPEMRGDSTCRWARASSPMARTRHAPPHPYFAHHGLGYRANERRTVSDFRTVVTATAVTAPARCMSIVYMSAPTFVHARRARWPFSGVACGQMVVESVHASIRRSSMSGAGVARGLDATPQRRQLRRRAHR